MKSTTKSTKSPAPATSSSPAPTLAPKTTRAPRVKQAAAAALTAAPSVAKSAATEPSPAPAPRAPAAPPPPTTVISARIDVGFGNSLYLRGSGPGLTWNVGVPLSCLAGNLWSISLEGALDPVVFKFLVNDERWSHGEDYVAAPGSSAEYSPQF
jgi:hypothetical protein